MSFKITKRDVECHGAYRGFMFAADYQIRLAHGETAQPPTLHACTPEVYAEAVRQAEAKADMDAEADQDAETPEDD